MYEKLISCLQRSGCCHQQWNNLSDHAHQSICSKGLLNLVSSDQSKQLEMFSLENQKCTLISPATKPRHFIFIEVVQNILQSCSQHKYITISEKFYPGCNPNIKEEIEENLKSMYSFPYSITSTRLAPIDPYTIPPK